VTPPLVLVPQYFGSLVFDRRTSRYAPFDHDATAVLRRTVDEPAWRSEHREFVRCFERAGYYAPDGRFAGVVLDAAPPADHLLGPLAVHVEVIAASNLACTHCFAGELPRKTTLATRDLDALFGSWSDCAAACTVSYRMARAAHGDAPAPNIGFRLVREASWPW
jgi:hypothetical protein